jgi:hypothetical protein
MVAGAYPGAASGVGVDQDFDIRFARRVFSLD